MPLIFNAQSARNKAGRLDYQIANAELETKKLKLNADYAQLLNKLQVLQQNLAYYRQTAIPLADEQISTSNIAFKAGEIDYVQYIQSLESAVEIKQDFLKQQAEFFILQAEIEFITGK